MGCASGRWRWAALEMWEALSCDGSDHRCDSEVLLTFLLLIFWEQGLCAVSSDSAWRCSKEQGVQIQIIDVAHSCALGSPSNDLPFFLALHWMWGPKCMTYACVYATCIYPMGLTLWLAYDLGYLRTVCLVCSFLLFWEDEVGCESRRHHWSESY